MPDITISIFSFISATCFFTIIAAIIMIGRKNTLFIARHGIHLLLTMLFLTFVRLLFPIDLYYAKIINISGFYDFFKKLLLAPIGTHYFVYHLLCGLWLLGFFSFIIYYMWGSVIEIRQLNGLDKTTCFELENTLKLHFSNLPLTTVVSPNIDVPKIYGFHTYHIYLPSLHLTTDEWKYIIKHEIQHVKNHDTLIKCIFLIIKALFWWNPIVHLLFRELDQMLEIRCDASLKKQFSYDECTEYLQTLFKVIKQKNTPTMHQYTTSAFVNHSTYALTKQRILLIKEKPSKNIKATITNYGIVFLLFLASYFIIFQPHDASLKNDATTSIEPSLILHTSEDEYELYIDGKFYKTLTEDDIMSGNYSNYELIEGIE